MVNEELDFNPRSELDLEKSREAIKDFQQVVRGCQSGLDVDDPKAINLIADAAEVLYEALDKD